MRMDTGLENSSLASASILTPLWVKAVALVGTGLLAAGAAIACFKPGMLLSPAEPITEGVRVYAGYLIARNAGLALMLLAALVLRARTLLGHMLLLVGIIQILDAVVNAFEGRWVLIPGVTALGVVFLLAASSIARSAERQTR